jgi:pentose-5-phosphate-3-epimerase
MVAIVPACIPESISDVFSVAKRYKPFSREIHIDVTDGIFTPHASWPMGGGERAGEPHEIRTLADMFDIEFDLMLADSLLEIPRYVSARARRIVVHAETCLNVALARDISHAAHVELGLAASLDTPLELFLNELQYADYAQCMGIAHIGSHGQPFDERVYEYVDAVRQAYPAMPISVDGAMNTETIPRLSQYNVSRFVVGSPLRYGDTPEEMYRALMVSSDSAHNTIHNTILETMHA